MGSSSFPRLLVNASGRASGNEQPSLLFAGDFYLRPDHLVQNPTDIFAPATIELVQQSSFSVLNFEGTLAAGDDRGIRKEGPHLALHHRAPALLRSAGFHGITLANNHAMDYGEDALRRTLQACADCGLQHAGAGFNSKDATQPMKVCLPGNVRLQILSFCEREFGVSVDNIPGTAWLTGPGADRAVGRAKQESDIVIVCVHGGNEFMPLPSAQRRRQLQRLIDAGADLVIGHHPHVPQGWEQYAGRHIFYSLGDFYFDSTDGRRYEYRDWGFMVRVHFDERRIKTLEIMPYERVDDKILPLGSRKDVASHLLYLEQLSASSQARSSMAIGSNWRSSGCRRIGLSCGPCSDTPRVRSASVSKRLLGWAAMPGTSGGSGAAYKRPLQLVSQNRPWGERRSGH